MSSLFPPGVFESPFQPAWWLRNPHAQTLFSTFFRRPPLLARRREELVLPDAALLEREARRVLRRLAEPGAVLAFARDMDKAAVLREFPDGRTARTAVTMCCCGMSAGPLASSVSIVSSLLAAVWFGALDTPLYYLNNIVWELLGKGTGYIDKIAYSIYYAGLGTVV